VNITSNTFISEQRLSERTVLHEQHANEKEEEEE
jgi:hypothetical protein